MFFCFFVFVFSVFFFFSFSLHYMYLLLFLEMMLLMSFMFLSFDGLIKFGLVGLFIFLLVIVCMGGFSVSLLVSLARIFGRDFSKLIYLF